MPSGKIPLDMEDEEVKELLAMIVNHIIVHNFDKQRFSFAIAAVDHKTLTTHLLIGTKDDEAEVVVLKQVATAALVHLQAKMSENPQLKGAFTDALVQGKLN